MDILNQISTQIAALNSGEKWHLSAQDLFISHADFHSLSIYISREAKKGQFSVSSPALLGSWVGSTAVIINYKHRYPHHKKPNRSCNADQLRVIQ